MDNEEILLNLGYSKVENSPNDLDMYLVDEETKFSYSYTNSANESELLFCQKLDWFESPIIILLEGQIILTGSFFILNSNDVPISSKEARDYFDYKVEPEIKRRLNNSFAYIGPHWKYIYETSNILDNLSNKFIKITAGIVGNNFNIKEKTVDEVLKSFEEIKEIIKEMTPFPIFFGFPVGMTIGSIDNYYDNEDKKWYNSSIQDEKGIVMSILDLPTDLDEHTSFKHHTFSKKPTLIEDFNLMEKWIYFLTDKNKVINRRKLKNLKIID